MTTRNPNIPGLKLCESHTEFQMHKSQNEWQSIKSIIDFTEHRLVQVADNAEDEQQKATLKKLLKDYKSGSVAVAWKSGKPVWLNVVKESA